MPFALSLPVVVITFHLTTHAYTSAYTHTHTHARTYIQLIRWNGIGARAYVYVYSMQLTANYVSLWSKKKEAEEKTQTKNVQQIIAQKQNKKKKVNAMYHKNEL